MPPTATSLPTDSSPASAPPVDKLPSRGRRRGLLLGVLILALASAAGGGGLWWRYAHSVVARSAPLPQLVEPVAPPPAFAPVLAGPSAADEAESTAATALASRLDQLTERAATSVAKSLPEGDNLIVLPGRQAPQRADDQVRHERWEVRLPPDVTLESYARQLDFFGIELGVVGGNDEVVYLSGLADPQPRQRAAPATREGRLYLTWQRGGLAEADRQLAGRAKLDLKGKLIAQFCPDSVERELADLERAYAKKNKVQAVRKTVFGIRPEGKGFKFYVMEQLAADDKPK